jgi:general secretion pathway protein A
VLVGQPELRDLVSQPRLVQFAQRVAAEYHIPGMSAATVAGYVAHRLKVAGAEREIFTPAACECVHLASRGIPRLVNQICDYALVYAFTDGLERVDASVIEQVVTDRRMYGNLRATA